MAKGKAKKRRRLTPEEKEQRQHRRDIRAIFRNAGFVKIDGVNRNFTFENVRGELDDIYIYENVIVLIEYTCASGKHLSAHLKQKKILFDVLRANPAEFVEFADAFFTDFNSKRDKFYSPEQCRVVLVYASKNSIGQSHKDLVTGIKFFDYRIVKYFQRLTNTIRLSARFELFAFFELQRDEIGKQSTSTFQSDKRIKGTLLPEGFSNFPKGFKIVSFYADPAYMLERVFVMRKDSWKDDEALYQRMIQAPKIRAIRKYLRTAERVFVNNIIVTLPGKTKLLNENDDTVDPSQFKSTMPVTIQVPDAFNSIGIIDGQHRVLAYHEGGDDDDKIRELREKQNLLTTGIIYPSTMKGNEKIKFEAKLFLEINSTQTGAATDLKQSIGLILNPFSAESIAKAVLNKLNQHGPLENQFESHFFEKGKIKTSSIVSFALKPIAKLSGNDSFFAQWTRRGKNDLLDGKDDELRQIYVDYCASEINAFMSAVKQAVGEQKWTTDKNVKNKVLSTTALNGLIICLRRLILEGKTGDADYYKKKLANLDTFKFSEFKSSQYGAMSRRLYETFFS